MEYTCKICGTKNIPMLYDDTNDEHYIECEKCGILVGGRDAQAVSTIWLKLASEPVTDNQQAGNKICPHYAGERATNEGDIPVCNHPDLLDWPGKQ